MACCGGSLYFTRYNHLLIYKRWFKTDIVPTFHRSREETDDMNTQPNNPLHGITLQTLLSELVDHYGWEELGRLVNIRCFNNDPSMKSSLKFLRRTEWARKEVEQLYLDTFFI